MNKIKNIRDYLPFYIGATCIADGNHFILHGVEILIEGTMAFDGSRLDGVPQGWWVENCNFKLALKPFDHNMLVRIISEIRSQRNQEWDVQKSVLGSLSIDFPEYSAAQTTKWMCENQYDVFGLIKSGLAIDIETLNIKS